jgi:superfamily I DNA/RNA helicase
MWNFVREGQVTLPLYDVVLIDEAQFFAPIWFDIVRRIVQPKSGHLFIVADPTQGFLGRGTSWKSVGIDARGKTNNLRRSYRTTHEILNFATLFYRKRVPKNDSDEEILEPDLMNMPRGVLPVLLPVRSSQDEIGMTTAEIVALHKSGYPLKNVLVLHAEYGVDALIESLNRHLGEGKAADPKNIISEDCVRVTTLNAGTGLESPIVFLVGLNRLFEREQSLRLSDEEADRLVLENTRKVYMAATRAGQRLVITYVGEVPDMLKELLTTRIGPAE